MKLTRLEPVDLNEVLEVIDVYLKPMNQVEMTMKPKRNQIANRSSLSDLAMIKTPWRGEYK